MVGGGSPWKFDPSGVAFRTFLESLDSVAAADLRDRVVQLAFLESEADPDSSTSLRDFVEGPLRRAILSVLDAEAADRVTTALGPLMDGAPARSPSAAVRSSPSGRSDGGFRKAIPRDEPARPDPSKSPFLVRRSTRPAGQAPSEPVRSPFREEVVDAEPRRLGWKEEVPSEAAAARTDVAERASGPVAAPPSREDEVAAELRRSIRREILPGIREEAVTNPSRRAPAPVPKPPAVQSAPPATSIGRAEVLVVTADRGVADDLIERLAGRVTARWVSSVMEMMRSPEIGSDSPPRVVLDLCSLPVDTGMLASMAPVIPPQLRIILWGAPGDLQSTLQGTGWNDIRWTAVDGSASADEIVVLLS